MVIIIPDLPWWGYPLVVLGWSLLIFGVVTIVNHVGSK